MTEARLNAEKEIATVFGETLSWEYLCYVRNHPLKWNIPTRILYGENDNLTSIETITDFAEVLRPLYEVSVSGRNHGRKGRNLCNGNTDQQYDGRTLYHAEVSAI